MAIQERFCVNHPQRQAIGICVETRRPICEECSTRYEGVNYSKEGLALLQQRRLAKSKSHSFGEWGLAILACAATPTLLYLMYLYSLMCASFLMSYLRGEV